MCAYPKPTATHRTSHATQARTYDPFTDDESGFDYEPSTTSTTSTTSSSKTAPARSWAAKPGAQHIRVRDLDRSVVAALRREAKLMDRSLNWLLVRILTDYANGNG